jgi:hypothetical protein
MYEPPAEVKGSDLNATSVGSVKEDTVQTPMVALSVTNLLFYRTRRARFVFFSARRHLVFLSLLFVTITYSITDITEPVTFPWHD